MSKLHDVYHLTITTLSPLHIGTGNRLLRDYDFVVHGGKTWVIDQGALAEMLYDAGGSGFADMAKGVKARDLLHDTDYDPASPIFRYVMHGEPRAKTSGSEIQEQIKDAWDRPYIPGSSLKGALRTALAFVGWAQRGMKFEPSQLTDRRPKFAALPMECRVLNKDGISPGRAPNHDLLRALQVSDSAANEQQRLNLSNVQVFTGDKPASPVELETIPSETVFTAQLVLDGFLRRPEYARTLGWEDDQLTWLSRIAKVVNLWTENRIGAEHKRWGRLSDMGMLRSFYKDLSRKLKTCNGSHEFILQLGWGGGWDSKTFGAVLTENNDAFKQVADGYKLKRKGQYRPGEVFPKSRRLLVGVDGTPTRPLGWIHVKMERK